jgi:hypothetical protein
VFVRRSDERRLVALAAPMHEQLRPGAEVVEPSHMSNERSSICTYILNI